MDPSTIIVVALVALGALFTGFVLGITAIRAVTSEVLAPPPRDHAGDELATGGG